jgi:protein gp37
MGEKTEIAWTDSTFNPWLGCMKVSAGCDNCYAETMMDKRYHRVEWGQRKTGETPPSVGTRVRTAESNWRNPVMWNARARGFNATFGRRRRVFCSSLADVFDNQVPDEWRIDLWKMIRDTPDLNWLLLTKRPENIEGMLPVSWRDDSDLWQHVWLGTTCEDQTAYDKRWPILRNIPAAVRFISYEPAIGPLRLPLVGPHPDWLICGGESGRGYRDMPEKWARDIISDCRNTLVVPFMKQMAGKREIPADLLVREFPVTA